jgi:CRISPR-associated protein Cmr1
MLVWEKYTVAIYDFKLKLISPAFIAGTDKNNPEMRAASVRGQLRYWLRAMVGASTDSLEEVRQRESAVFGSTSIGSKVSVRVYGRAKTEKVAMLPHREGTKNNVSKAEAIKLEQRFQLQFATRPGVSLPDDALYALALWSLLGGIGRRSRRMMGAVEVQPQSDVTWYDNYQSPEEFKETILNVLNSALVSPIGTTQVPSFPVLRPNNSWIIIGAAADSYEEANQKFFRELLRNTTFKPNQDVFGYAKGRNRRASPLHAQVRRIGDDYYPVITAFRSEPMDKPNYSNILHDFMQAALRHYNGIHVWGGW